MEPQHVVKRGGEDRRGSGPQLCSPARATPRDIHTAGRAQTKKEQKVGNKNFTPTKYFILAATPFQK